MSKLLKTDWKIIGRSGATVDGRTIEPIWLEQAAKNYKKELFTALIWPEHERWYNMGTVEALRTAKNDEGGIDLLAQLAPNEYYQSSNAYGQKLFTSMELMPNFRDGGEYYLTGLAATDNPASVGTSEMRFSAINNRSALLSEFIESTDYEEDQPPGWFSRFFANKTQQNDEDDMKNALAALTQRFAAIEQRLDASLKGNDEGKPAESETKQTEDFSTLSAKVDKLIEQFTELKAAPASNADNEQFKQLAADFKQLRQDFDAAINKAEGTDAGENTGDSIDPTKYL